MVGIVIYMATYQFNVSSLQLKIPESLFASNVAPGIYICAVDNKVYGEFVHAFQKIAKNIGMIITENVGFRLIFLFVTICLARYLGTAGFGKYGFVLAYLVFFNIIIDVRLQQIIVREMVRNPTTDPTLIGNAYVIRLLLTVLAVVLSITIPLWLPYPADTTLYIYIVAFMLFSISFCNSHATIFQANLARGYNTIAKLTSKFVSAAVMPGMVQIVFWNVPYAIDGQKL